MNKTITGFSKLTKEQKIQWLIDNFLSDTHNTEGGDVFKKFWYSDENFQKVFDGFSENTISNFPIPFGIAPNFIINGKPYAIPMVIEESSVVAAASSAAKYWMERGGFHAEVLCTQKVGQVHFTWSGDAKELKNLFASLKETILEDTAFLTQNMRARGGGILDIVLEDFNEVEKDYYQLKVTFETCDSMGANFINSVLEEMGNILTHFLKAQTENAPIVIMSILSNYTPECIVRAWVECDIEDFHDKDAAFYAEKFRKAVRIANIDPYRAVTHNKGIFNGIDAVVLATANDFRAIEACGHAYAARDGQYRSLSKCTIEGNRFKFWIDIPLAVGTVGGLTRLHPLAKLSLELLGNPSASELMQIIAVMGLAQNFGAVRSLVTTGIQKGHMKMHLSNILNHFSCTEGEENKVRDYFEDKIVSFSAIRDFVGELRKAEEV
jgi:hydroxymethylglutaryl-CoA reductase